MAARRRAKGARRGARAGYRCADRRIDRKKRKHRVALRISSFRFRPRDVPMNDSSEALQGRARAESRGADFEQARTAVALVLPLIHEAMREPRYGDSGFLHIVVMDPARTPANVAAF